MAASKCHRIDDVMARSVDSGQSIVEFVLLLPLLVALTILLIRMNSAIQVSIVNQKYARLQAHFLTFNSPFYPSRQLNGGLGDNRVKGMHHLTLGVGEDAISGSNNRPRAVEVFVARNRTIASQASNAGQSEPDLRARIRVRSTVSLCSYSHTVGGGRDVYDATTLRNFDKDDATRGDAGKLFNYCNWQEAQ